MFLTTLGSIKDADNRTLPLAETINAIVQSGRFVIFSMEDAYITGSVVGGLVTSGHSQGQARHQGKRPPGYLCFHEIIVR